MQPMPPTQPVTRTFSPVSNAPVTDGQVRYPPLPNAPVPNSQMPSSQMPNSQMPADPETAAFLRAVRRRQLIWIVIGGAVALAAIIALLIWPEEVKQGVVQGAQSFWRLLMMIFGGIGG